MQECLEQRAVIAQRKATGSPGLVSTPGLNLAFSRAGFDALGLDGIDPDSPFAQGMAASQGALGDPDPETWAVLGPDAAVHGVFLVTGATEAEVDNTIALRLAPAGGNGWDLVHTEVGTVRPEPVAGHEHFGYADGVSQPAPRGLICPGQPLEPTVGSDQNQADPGRDLLWPGEFLFGYPAQNPAGPKLTVPGPVQDPPIPFMANGAFLVFRRLRQNVPEFDQAVKAAAAGIDAANFDPASAELFGAQLVGRWKSGAPLINAPRSDNPAIADGQPDVNDFEFGGDREGLICPWAAHIRKAYPRDDVRHNVDPSDVQIDLAESSTQTHRMLRRGIAFGPELTGTEAVSGQTAEDRGLLFACYVTDIAGQFEFVQRAWVNSADFSQPDAGVDALIGQGASGLPFRGAAPVSLLVDHKPDLTFDRFVQMQGGEYFFAPSIPTIRDLGK